MEGSQGEGVSSGAALALPAAPRVSAVLAAPDLSGSPCFATR